MGKYNAEVIDIREVDKHIKVMRVKPDKEYMDFKAGQYTTLGLDGHSPRLAGAEKEDLPEEKKDKVVKRAYSISSPIIDDQYSIVDHNKLPYLEFYISLMLKGDNPKYPPFLTPRLFMLKNGDRIHLGTKAVGHYTLNNVRPEDNVIFISTGTGQAPHNTMLARLLRDGHKGKVAMIECNRYRHNFGYDEQIEEISESYDNIFYEKMVTTEKRDYYVQNLFQERVLEEKYGFEINSSNTHVYLCGNPIMIGAPKLVSGVEVFERTGGMVALLQSQYSLKTNYRGCTGTINFEKYW
jgi:ferredoxin--NADP+ reductase